MAKKQKKKKQKKKQLPLATFEDFSKGVFQVGLLKIIDGENFTIQENKSDSFKFLRLVYLQSKNNDWYF